jgi:hypothetical protein
MTSASDANAPLVLVERLPGFARLLLLAAGLFCIAVPAWELRQAFRELGWWTAFFGVIVVGAWSVGVSLVLAAIAGDDRTWTIADGKLVLDRQSLLRRRTDTYRLWDFRSMQVEVNTHDSGPDTYRVVMHLRRGGVLQTPDRATREGAEELKADIRRRLGGRV